MLAYKNLEARFEQMAPSLRSDGILQDIMRKAHFATERFEETLAAYYATDDEFVIGGGEADGRSAIHYNAVMHRLTAEFDARESALSVPC